MRLCVCYKLIWSAKRAEFTYFHGKFTFIGGKGKDKKVTFFPLHALKAYRGSGVVVPLILNLGTSWGRVVIVMPSPFYPREGTTVPIE
jgi:hypothetical protein